MKEYDIINTEEIISRNQESSNEIVEEIVKVKGSSSCFEYQYPASPEFFIGREHTLANILDFIDNVKEEKTTSRGILFLGNSGWGKSSIALSIVDKVQKRDDFAIAIDSRSASSSQFILRVIDFVFRENDNFQVISNSIDPQITGVNGAINTILSLGQELKKHNKILILLFDQFENVFFLENSLKKIRDVFFKIQDAQTNIVFGFLWKTDLIGLMTDFPYKIRDSISDNCKTFYIEQFSSAETEILLQRLENEIHKKLRKDLHFFLADFSQGYPWLLKKLCAHVKLQIEKGKQQADIAFSLLNIEELFKEDLNGLSPEEEDTLRRISNIAPIGIQELGEDFHSNVIQSLVHRRLLIRIGNKYDIYWDVFRDYLNIGKVPVQENFLLRSSERVIIKSLKMIFNNGGILKTSNFQTISRLKGNYYYNVLRDMKALGLVDVDEDSIKITLESSSDELEFESILASFLNERLKRNRIVWNVLQELDQSTELNVDDIARILQNSCGYISASENTWKIYARTLIKWLWFSELIIYNKEKENIQRFVLGKKEIKDSRPVFYRFKEGVALPPIQYKPVEEIAIRLFNALDKKKNVNWAGLKRTTISKSLAALEELEFIKRAPGTIYLYDNLSNFVENSQDRQQLFSEAALKIKAFKTFIEILNENTTRRLSLKNLGLIFNEKLGKNWKENTSTVHAKISLDWARNSGLAPVIYVKKYGHYQKSKSLDEY